MKNLDVYCFNCGEHILTGLADDLRTPLNGSMFRPREDREFEFSWPFEEDTLENDLSCPFCEALFHEQGALFVPSEPDDMFLPLAQEEKPMEKASEEVMGQTVETATVMKAVVPKPEEVDYEDFKTKITGKTLTKPEVEGTPVKPKKKDRRGWKKGTPRDPAKKKKWLKEKFKQQREILNASK